MRTSSGDLGYDSLVVALGVRLAPETVPGFEQMAHNLYTSAGCARIHAALEDLREGTIGILITALPFRCPAAPLRGRLPRRGVLAQEGNPTQGRDPPLQPRAHADADRPIADRRLDRRHTRGARRPLPPAPSQSFARRRARSVASDGRSHRIDLLIAIPPHQAPDVIRSSPLLGVSGFIHVDAETLQSEREDVFAIGDVATIRLPNDKALPKAGVFAHGEAKVVAQRIADGIDGKTSRAAFDGKGYCWLELGDGRAGFAGGDFYTEPEPRLKMRRPGRPLHWGKVAFEKWWLHHWL